MTRLLAVLTIREMVMLSSQSLVITEIPVVMTGMRMRLYNRWIRSVVRIEIVCGVGRLSMLILTVSRLGFLVVFVIEGGGTAKVGSVESHRYRSGIVGGRDRVGKNGRRV
jgi:hypothetical protein